MYRYTDSGELQDCPAEVDMDNGDIYINRDVWDKYTKAEKMFVIQHEHGHYNLQTDDEREADNYALKQNFGKIRDSLRSSFSALEKANVKSGNRWEELYKNALSIDAENGNERAREELNKIQSTNYKPIKSNNMRNYPGQITYIQPDYNSNQVERATVYSRLDGEEGSIDMPEGNGRKSHKKNGIQVGEYYLSFTNILLLAIFILLVSKKK